MGTDNLHHKRKAKQLQDLQRREGRRKAYDRVLVVCEGEKTEPNYLNELKDCYRLSSANVEVTGDGGSSPMSVVRYAQELQQKALNAGFPYDRIFCVFDRDTHPDYQPALDNIAAMDPEGVFTAVTSIPCFEYWLLLHFTYTDKPFHATGKRSVAAMVEKELKRYWPGYRKAAKGSFTHTANNLEYAKNNAQRVLNSAQRNNHDNPSTHVHELVAYLQALKTRPATEKS